MRGLRKTYRETGKVPLDLNPRSAAIEQALAHARGNVKPGRGAFNWRLVNVSLRENAAAIKRHVDAYLDGADRDAEGAHHMGAVMARAAILIDAGKAGTLIDDRVPMPAKKKRRR
jgi:hypothetical protein